MIRRTIPKHIRQQVYEKYGGCCAYRCIKEFEIAEVNKYSVTIVTALLINSLFPIPFSYSS